MNLAVNRVGIDVKSEYLERVGMHIQGVTLRKIHHYSTIGTHGIARHVVVFSEITRQLVLVDGVGIYNIVKALLMPVFSSCITLSPTSILP